MTQDLTNREMHELAAKAAGVDGVWVETHGTEVGQDACGIGQSDSRFCDKLWRPREDDGDAHRLAVRLGLTVCNEHESAGVVYCTRAENEEFPAIKSGIPGDPIGITPSDYAATREAIFQAAVAIGKAMP